MRLLLVLAALTSTAAAQPVWRPAPDGPSVSLDVLKSVGGDRMQFTNDLGEFVGEGGPSLFQSAQILSARVPVGGRVVVVGELPFAFADYSVPDGVEDAFGPGTSDFGVGNPYVGAEYAVSGEVALGGGVRLPFASESPTIVFDGFAPGFLADFERPEAFLPHAVSATLGVWYERPLTPAVGVRVELAPTLSDDARGSVEVSPGNGTDDPFDPDPVVWARYGVQVVGAAGPVVLHCGLVGRQHVAGDSFVVGDAGSFVGGAVARGLPVQPGLLVRVPVRGAFKPDPVVGLSLTVPLP